MLQTQFRCLLANPLRKAKRFKCFTIFRHFSMEQKNKFFDEINKLLALFRCASEKTTTCASQLSTVDRCGNVKIQCRHIHACDAISHRNKNKHRCRAQHTSPFICFDVAAFSIRTQNVKKNVKIYIFSLLLLELCRIAEFRCCERFQLSLLLHLHLYYGKLFTIIPSSICTPATCPKNTKEISKNYYIG